MKKNIKIILLFSYFLIILNYLSNFIFSLIKIDNKIFNILTFLFLFLIELILLKNLYYHNIFTIMCFFNLLYNYQTKNIIFYFCFYKYYSLCFSIST